MRDFLKTKCSIFYINIISLVLTLVGGVFFILSYGTGYIGIQYGENHSITITILVGAILLITIVSALLQIINKVDKKEFYNVAMYVLVVLYIFSILFLFVDRVDAIGNCIVAPWDAGHGGEDSCYLSFVSIGCWFVSMIASIVGTFIGFRKKN